jgi:acetyl-CoA acetyltransferase
MTDMTHRVYGKTPAQFAASAIRAAAADAGVNVSEIQGLLTNGSSGSGIGLSLAAQMALCDLRMQSEIQSYGASAAAMIQYASMAVACGMAETVACAFADAPLSPTIGAGAGRFAGPTHVPAGFDGILTASDIRTPATRYALAASRHMAYYGTTSEHLAAVAVSTRAWATMNPLAQMREPLTVEQHQSSRFITEPFHLFDCCLVSNGGAAVIVTTAERARDLPVSPVYILGWGQAHPGYERGRGSDFGLRSGAATSGPEAMKMAGITINDIDIAEIYDCFTFTTLISLEDYGFCDKGEGGEFVASGAIGPGGRCPTNTGGGQLSSYYMWGMTPLSEAIMQVRDEAGQRQLPKHELALVSGNGGFLDHHATLILGSQA